jgi:hypothetical protein
MHILIVAFNKLMGFGEGNYNIDNEARMLRIQSRSETLRLLSRGGMHRLLLYSAMLMIRSFSLEISLKDALFLNHLLIDQFIYATLKI